MAGDQEKEVSKKFLENGHKSQMTEEAYLRELKKIRRYFMGLLVLVVIAFLILTILFSVLFANLKYDVENHSHPPKVGEQMSNILEKEELCIPCGEVRLGPSYEEDRALDVFVRKPKTENDPEQCCVETPTQLLKMLQLVSTFFLLFRLDPLPPRGVSFVKLISILFPNWLDFSLCPIAHQSGSDSLS